MKKRELTIAHHGRDVHGYFYEPDTKEYPLIISYDTIGLK